MCGFGDKVSSNKGCYVYSYGYNRMRMGIVILTIDAQDRRPITPPPCIRLVITDTITGKEVDVK